MVNIQAHYIPDPNGFSNHPINNSTDVVLGTDQNFLGIDKMAIQSNYKLYNQINICISSIRLNKCLPYPLQMKKYDTVRAEHR